MSIIQSNVYETRCLQLEVWQISQDPAANTSLVGWELRSVGGYSAYYYTADTTVTIGTETVYTYHAPPWDTDWASKTFPVKTGSVSGQLTVPHNPDGKKTLSFCLSTRVYISTVPADFGGALVLTDIPPAQASGLTAADMVLGQPCQVTWTPSPGLFYRLQFVVGSKYQAVWGMYPNRTAPYTYRGTDLSPLLAQGMPTGRQAEMLVTLTACRDADCTQAVGSPVTASCTVTVPETQEFLPEASLTLSPTGALPQAFAGLYIQGITGLEARLPAQGQQGAAIQSRSLQADGQIRTGDGEVLTLGPLNRYGAQTVTAAVRDTRGMTRLLTQDIQVLPYARPRIQGPGETARAQLIRCDSSGQEADGGGWLRIRARRSYSPLMAEGTPRNRCQVSMRIRGQGDWSAWTTLLAAEAAEDSFDTGPLLGTLDPALSYQVQLQALDDLGQAASTTLTLSTQRVYSHRDGARGAFAFGKLAEEENTFDLAPDKTLVLRGGLRLSQEAAEVIWDIAHPVGSILDTAQAEAPALGLWQSMTSPAEGIYRWQRTQ